MLSMCKISLFVSNFRKTERDREPFEVNIAMFRAPNQREV